MCFYFFCWKVLVHAFFEMMSNHNSTDDLWSAVLLSRHVRQQQQQQDEYPSFIEREESAGSARGEQVPTSCRSFFLSFALLDTHTHTHTLTHLLKSKKMHIRYEPSTNISDERRKEIDDTILFMQLCQKVRTTDLTHVSTHMVYELVSLSQPSPLLRLPLTPAHASPRLFGL